MTREEAEQKLRLVPDLDMDHPNVVEILEEIESVSKIRGELIDFILESAELQKALFPLAALAKHYPIKDHPEPGSSIVTVHLGNLPTVKLLPSDAHRAAKLLKRLYERNKLDKIGSPTI